MSSDHLFGDVEADDASAPPAGEMRSAALASGLRSLSKAMTHVRDAFAEALAERDDDAGRTNPGEAGTGPSASR